MVTMMTGNEVVDWIEKMETEGYRVTIKPLPYNSEGDCLVELWKGSAPVNAAESPEAVRHATRDQADRLRARMLHRDRR